MTEKMKVKIEEKKVPNKWMVLAMYAAGLFQLCNAWLQFHAGMGAIEVNLTILTAGFILYVAIVTHKERNKALQVA